MALGGLALHSAVRTTGSNTVETEFSVQIFDVERLSARTSARGS